MTISCMTFDVRLWYNADLSAGFVPSSAPRSAYRSVIAQLDYMTPLNNEFDGTSLFLTTAVRSSCVPPLWRGWKGEMVWRMMWNSTRPIFLGSLLSCGLVTYYNATYKSLWYFYGVSRNYELTFSGALFCSREYLARMFFISLKSVITSASSIRFVSGVLSDCLYG